MVTAQPEKMAEALEGRRRPRPHPMSVEEAQEIYDAHIPSMHERICLACFGQQDWPCRPYREARDTLILSGRIQDGPLRPSV